MAIDTHIDWAQRLIAYHERGDFSAIGRSCGFSAAAWARMRARWGKRRVEPSRGLIGQRYDTRAALCEALRAAGATAPDDDLDGTFWRLADRGYARFLEAFDWVLPRWETEQPSIGPAAAGDARSAPARSLPICQNGSHRRLC